MRWSPGGEAGRAAEPGAWTGAETSLKMWPSGRATLLCGVHAPVMGEREDDTG